MQRMLLFLLTLACATAGAQVFKRTGPDGKVYFSDQPGPDAVQVEVAPVQTISSPTLPAQAEIEESPDNATAYTQFSIVSPGSGQEIRPAGVRRIARGELECTGSGRLVSCWKGRLFLGIPIAFLTVAQKRP
jgi:hypothetical protein